MTTPPAAPSDPAAPAAPVEPIEPDAPAAPAAPASAPIESAAPASAPNEPAVPAPPTVPYGSAPNEAAAYAAPGAAPGTVPNGAPQTAARRKWLPGWAWALIAGAAVVMIAAIVVIVLIVNTVLGGLSGSDEAVQPAATATPSAAETSAPIETDEPTDAPTAEPTDGGSAVSAGVTSLDETVDRGMPYWSFPIVDGWEITTFDEQGVNQAENLELDCLFTTSQNRQPADDLTATSDRVDTETSVSALAQQMVAAVETAEIVGDFGSADVAVALSDSTDRLEFATARVDYVNPNNGDPYTNVAVGRAMPAAEAYLYYVVSCPTALVDSGAGPFDELTDALTVVFE